LLGASAFFIPNAVLASGKNLSAKELKGLSVDPKKTLLTQPNLKDYKFNTDGTTFFKSASAFRRFLANSR